MILVLLAPAFAAAPTAVSSSASLNEDGSALVTLRATDPENDALTYAIVTNPTKGTVSVAGNRATYRPNANQNGTDSFTFRARDAGGANSNTATVSLTITAVNDAPTTSNLSGSGPEDTNLSLSPSVSDVDSSAFTWSISSAPAQGSATIQSSTGRITYTPAANWNGVTTLRFQVSDGSAAATGTATLTLTAVNDAPSATAQSVTATEDTNATITLSGSDPENSPLSYAIASAPAHGSVGLNNRTAVYTPSADYSGADSFTFTTSDGTLTSAAATVTINVSGVNDPPIAYPSHGITDGRTLSFYAYSSDVDSAVGTPTLATAPAHGSASVRFGRLRYVPQAGYTGADSFTFAVSDGTSTATAAVRVSVVDTYASASANWSQVGVNNIPFYADAGDGGPSTASTLFQGSYILDTLSDMGVETYRQLRSADVCWESFMIESGALIDADTEDLLAQDDIEPRLTLFDTMYASPTPPWASTPGEFQKSMTAEAYAYLDEVLSLYSGEVRYWEVGNEMFHWSVLDSADFDPADHPDLHDSYPLSGYSPEEQAEFLQEVSEYVRAQDSDAVIVLSSVIAGSDETDEWLERVVAHAGSDWFDVVTWHAYDEWDIVRSDRSDLTAELESLGLEEKLVQLTEVGSSAEAALNTRTDYPNSTSTQAADVFRYLIPAFAAGDSHVTWHTYRELSEGDTGTMAGLALFEHDGTARPASYAMGLLTSELLPLAQATDLSDPDAGVYKYALQGADGTVRYVAWGSGTLSVPAGLTQYTSVIPSSQGTYTWAALGSTVTLSDYPVLMR